ncbi:hypothetical protein BDW62DRAFT_199084 [Aspergillus aurantiobrunneus]
MARPGREEEEISFIANSTPISGRMSKSLSKSKTSTTGRRNPIKSEAIQSAPEFESKNINENTESSSHGDIVVNVEYYGDSSPTKLTTEAEPGLEEDRDKDKNNDNNEPDPEDDLYTPLLKFICSHGFMRKKRYPVPRSWRESFVRDVRGEGAVLGYERTVVDRVLLDIKRYYLEVMGQGGVFDEGVEFGDEVDDSSSSSGEIEASGEYTSKKGFKDKRSRGISAGASEKQLVGHTSLPGRAALVLDIDLSNDSPDEEVKPSKVQKQRKRKRNIDGEMVQEAPKKASQNFKSIHGKIEKSPSSGKAKTQKKQRSRPKNKLQSLSGAAFEGPIVLDF